MPRLLRGSAISMRLFAKGRSGRGRLRVAPNHRKYGPRFERSCRVPPPGPLTLALSPTRGEGRMSEAARLAGCPRPSGERGQAVRGNMRHSHLPAFLDDVATNWLFAHDMCRISAPWTGESCS